MEQVKEIYDMQVPDECREAFIKQRQVGVWQMETRLCDLSARIPPTLLWGENWSKALLRQANETAEAAQSDS